MASSKSDKTPFLIVVVYDTKKEKIQSLLPTSTIDDLRNVIMSTLNIPPNKQKLVIRRDRTYATYEGNGSSTLMSVGIAHMDSIKVEQYESQQTNLNEEKQMSEESEKHIQPEKLSTTNLSNSGASMHPLNQKTIIHEPNPLSGISQKNNNDRNYQSSNNPMNIDEQEESLRAADNQYFDNLLGDDNFSSQSFTQNLLPNYIIQGDDNLSEISVEQDEFDNEENLSPQEKIAQDHKNILHFIRLLERNESAVHELEHDPKFSKIQRISERIYQNEQTSKKEEEKDEIEEVIELNDEMLQGASIAQLNIWIQREFDSIDKLRKNFENIKSLIDTSP